MLVCTNMLFFNFEVVAFMTSCGKHFDTGDPHLAVNDFKRASAPHGHWLHSVTVQLLLT